MAYGEVVPIPTNPEFCTVSKVVEALFTTFNAVPAVALLPQIFNLANIDESELVDVPIPTFPVDACAYNIGDV